MGGGLLVTACAAGALAAGCGEEEGATPATRQTLDAGDGSRSQGVELVRGRAVPDLVAIFPLQPVEFTNRGDRTERVVKLSGPGRDFETGPIAPGEWGRVTPLGKPGYRIRTGTIRYRSEPGGAEGRIKVYGTLFPRRTGIRIPPRELPQRPDWAARHSALALGEYVSQCRPFTACDTPRELVLTLAHQLRFVAGSAGRAVESAVAQMSSEIWLGNGPDETEVEATPGSFVVIGHSRTGVDWTVQGTRRDRDSWSLGCSPSGRGECPDSGDWPKA